MIPKISILIPCYNAERWIAQAIESALKQTYENKEVIVVDDGSRDKSPGIIRDFRSKVRWETGPHRGANSTRNRLLELSRGEWLQYLDADDYLLPEKLANQINCLENAASADIVYSQVLLETKEGGVTVRKSAEKINPIKKERDIFVNFARWSFPQTGGVIFKKKTLIEVGGWKKDQPCCQEHELYLRLLMAGKEFIFCATEDAIYRITENKTLSRKDPLKAIEERMRITDVLEGWLKSSGMLNKKRQMAINMGRFECARSAYAHNKKLACSLMEKVKSNDKMFTPSGNAAPFIYRIFYKMIGFAAAEKIGSFKNMLFKK